MNGATWEGRKTLPPSLNRRNKVETSSEVIKALEAVIEDYDSLIQALSPLWTPEQETVRRLKRMEASDALEVVRLALNF